MSLVTIVIPIYQEKLSSYENISLQQCFSVLDNYPISFICPLRMKNGQFHNKNIENNDFIFIDDRYFESIHTYNEMLLSVWFYDFFRSYEYVLVYQLDCFVFSDKLNDWIKKGYSYIGAPWFKNNSNDTEVNEFYGVGNGGFSLRKVTDFIRVLNSHKKVYSFRKYLFQKGDKPTILHFIKSIKNYIFSVSFKSIHSNKLINEDKIFYEAGKRFDFFNIPDAYEALSFSFEKQSEKLYNLNSFKLPFGCHAWWKFNLEFYIPHIESFGYKITVGEENSSAD